MRASRHLPTLIALAALLPVALHAWMGRYAHPNADDFSYALKDISGGIGEALQWEYHHWNGRFSSNALVLLGPLRFGLHSLPVYRCVPAALLLLLLGSMHFFARCALRGTPQQRWAFPIAAVWLSIFLHLMPDIGDGLYWYTGAVTYTIAWPAVLIAVGLLRPSHHRSRGIRTALAALLLFLAVGMNEVMMLLLIIAVLVLVVHALIRRRPLPPGLWLPSAAVLVGAAIMLIAPGNAEREAHFTGTHRLFHSTGMSLLQTLRFGGSWSFCGTLIALSFLWWAEGPGYRSRIPGLADGFGLHPAVTMLMLGATVFLSVFPAYWSTGILGQHRTPNVACFLFVPLWFVNLSAWIQRYAPACPALLRKRTVTALLMTVLALDIALSGNGGKAVRDLLSGRAARFDEHMLDRYKRLDAARDRGERSAILPPITDPPRSLHVLDLRGPDFLVNRDYAAWWGLDEVRVETSP